MSYSGVYLGTILEEIGIPYKTVRIDTVKPGTLGDYPVVLLGRMPLTDAQANMLTRYALNQGHLIAMRPDQRLHDFFGIVESGSMDDAYYTQLIPDFRYFHPPVIAKFSVSSERISVW